MGRNLLEVDRLAALRVRGREIADRERDHHGAAARVDAEVDHGGGDRVVAAPAEDGEGHLDQIRGGNERGEQLELRAGDAGGLAARIPVAERRAARRPPPALAARQGRVQYERGGVAGRLAERSRLLRV